MLMALIIPPVVLRFVDGNFIKGFHCNIGISIAIFVELWGLFLGLKLARDHDVVQIVQCTSTHNAAVQPLLLNIFRLIHLPKLYFSLKYTYWRLTK